VDKHHLRGVVGVQLAGQVYGVKSAQISGADGRDIRAKSTVSGFVKSNLRWIPAFKMTASS
jgi:hypothetical protein